MNSKLTSHPNVYVREIWLRNKFEYCKDTSLLFIGLVTVAGELETLFGN